MSYDYRPTVQAHADAFTGLRDDADRVNPLAARRFEGAMPTPRTVVSTGRCRLACHERPCIEEGSIAAGGQTVSCGVCVRPRGVAAATQATLSAAASAGLPSHNGAGTTENPSEVQVRKGRPKRVLSTLFPQVSGGRLEVMNAHTREQPADRSNAATFPHSGPWPVRKHLAPRLAPLSVAFSPSRRRLCGHVPFDGARLVQGIVAESGDRPLSCAKEATAGKRTGRGRVG